MLIAYNNDIEYKNRWYHIQTEDNGIKDGHITTTVFFSGQILDSKSTSYREAISGFADEEQINAIIKDMMIKQHQMFYTRLFDGQYDTQMNLNHPHHSQQQQTLKPTITPSAVVSSPDAAAISAGISKIPDILKASQQSASVSKPVGLRSLSNLSPKTELPPKTDLSQKSPNSQLAPAPYPTQTAQAKSVAGSVPRNTNVINVLRSNAVEKARMNAPKRAWKGINWSEIDLSIDVLVASILDNA